MEKRRYFIIEVPNENVVDALDLCIGENDTQRYSLDGSKLYVKTNDELIKKKENQGKKLSKILPSGLATEYTHDEILEIMRTPEWQEPIDDII